MDTVSQVLGCAVIVFVILIALEIIHLRDHWRR